MTKQPDKEKNNVRSPERPQSDAAGLCRGEPALGDETPRQAIRSAKGRQAVIELLESYEHLEAHRARDQGGQPFDFGFLWEQLGLPRNL